MMQTISVRKADAQDQSYIASTWVRSFVERQRNNQYSHAKRAGELVDKILDNKDTAVLIAHKVSDNRTILGWIAYSKGTQSVVHYLYIRYPVRQHGIASQLLSSLGFAVDDVILWSMPGPDLHKLRAKYKASVAWDIKTAYAAIEQTQTKG